MEDAKLIAAAIRSRAAWDKVAAHFGVEEFGPLPKFWYPLIKEWYDRDPQAQSIDRDALLDMGKLRISNKKHEETLLGFIRDLPEPPSAENMVQVALEFKRFNVGMELGAAIANRDQKRIDLLRPKFNELWDATTLADKVRSEWEDAVAVEDLFVTVGHDQRIPIAPSKLNDRCDGGVLPGHHIIIFGRPEVGKSTFAINMAGSFVKRKIRTLYIGNEDKIHGLKARMLSRITGLPFEVAEANPINAAQRFREEGGEDYLLMTQLKRGTVGAIRERIEEFEPKVIVLDQIRNLMTGKSIDQDMTRKLEFLGIEVRQMLLEYDLIGVSVTQANDRTENSRQQNPVWLGMGDIDSSRTGLPAQGDLIIGIGANDEMLANDTRAVNPVKNKLSSARNSHQGFMVTIDRSRSKVV